MTRVRGASRPPPRRCPGLLRSQPEKRPTALWSISAKREIPSAAIHRSRILRTIDRLCSVFDEERLRPDGGSVAIVHRKRLAAWISAACSAGMINALSGNGIIQSTRLWSWRQPAVSMSNNQRSSPNRLRDETGAAIQPGPSSGDGELRRAASLIRSAGRPAWRQSAPARPRASPRESGGRCRGR